MFGEQLQPPPKEDRWNIVVKCLNDLYEAYNDRECSSVIPPQYRDPALDDRVDRRLYDLMIAYDNWLD